MMKKVSVLLLALLMSLVSMAQTAEECYENGKKSYESKDYANAYKWFKRAADQGNAKGQNGLAVLYKNGYGVTKDIVEAVKLYQKAAEQGFDKAQYNLAELYYDGEGVSKDYVEAAKWYQKAAEQGHIKAQNLLGYCYEVGQGVSQNYTESLKWYKKSADQGNSTAQCNVGLMYANGRGVEKDYAEAAKWYRKSAEQGYARAQNLLGYCYEVGQGVSQDYTESLKWYKKSADQGNSTAQCNVGLMYANGRGVEKDYAEAAKWYLKSGEQGYARAQDNLGCLYRDGKGVAKDYNEALKWYRKAAEQNYATGQANLGYMYEYGYGVDKDYAEALKWYRKSAEQNYSWSQDKMGDMYYNGRGTEKDDAEAVKWYQKAADNGNRGAKTSLGWMYENGCGVAKDLTMAVKLYREAADMGSASAQRNLGILYEKGVGVTQDYNEAEKWFKKALETNPNYQKVKDDLARLEKKKNPSKSDNEESEDKRLFNIGVDYFLGRNGVAQDYAQALTYFRQAAEMGMAAAQFNVGFFYENGHGVSQNCQEAVKWYKKAAEQENEESFVNLGTIYQHGRPGVLIDKAEAIKWYLKIVTNPDTRIDPTTIAGVQNNLGSLYLNQKNYVDALKWYRKAAEQGQRDAQYNLGIMYDQGWGVTKDEIEAVKWFMKAATQGHAGAQYNLGCAYRDGKGVRQNFVEANKWYLKAAEQGHAEAQNSIGISYLRGRGDFAKDSQKAIEWLQKAAVQGDVNGMSNIGTIYMDGDGVKRDLDKAEEWYKKALNADPDSDIKESLERLERNRNAGTMTVSVTVNMENSTEEGGTSNKETLLPLLEIVSNSLSFVDPSGANAVKANGKYKLKFQVKNTGKGVAKDCWVNVSTEGDRRNITVEQTKIDVIKVGEVKTVEVIVNSSQDICNGQLVFGVEVCGSDGLRSNEQYLAVSTRGTDFPMVMITDYSLTAASGKVLKKKEPFDLQLILQNVDLGQAEDISVEIELPSKVLMLDGEQSESCPKLEGGEAKSLVYSLIVRNDYTDPIIPITVHLKEKTGRYAKDRTISLTLDQSFASAKLSTKNFKDGRGFDMAKNTSDVDKDIPTASRTQEKTFALIIANENYEEVDPVPFASNDGAIFKTYCRQTLGIPEDNIHIISDASLGKMRRQVEWMQEVAQAYSNEARFIFYYAGHGIPDEKDKTAYLLPVDGFSRDLKTAYALDELYASLAKYPSKSVTVFLDACFSGAKREGSMLTSARGVAIKVKHYVPEGNIVVFSASQGDETAYPYDDQQHGMFTYYLLKKLKESSNNLTMGELADYVTEQVMQQSLKRNGKMQTPTILSSTAFGDNWKEMRIK